jgi:DNA-binding GntR family transcriptional regulator
MTGHKPTAAGTDPLRGTGAYARLRDEILHGALMPGDRLRAGDLQDRWGLGLTPIREALTRLTAEGLVTAEDHRGARVADISEADLKDLMATRRAIERLCLAQSIANGDAAWEAEIVAALHLLTRTPLPDGDADLSAMAAWEHQHRRFHYALVAACGSAWLLRIWNTLTDHAELYRKVRLMHYRDEATVSAVPQYDMNRNHARIAKAVLARDADRAMTLMDEHLAETERAVLRLMARQR